MRVQKHLTASWLACVLCAVSCSNDDESAKPVDMTPVAQAICDTLNRCGADMLWYGGESRCTERVKMSIASQTYPGTMRNAGWVSECAAAINSGPCYGESAEAEEYFNYSACPPTPGKRANGETCSHGLQCNSLRCGYSEGTELSCRVCLASGGLGESCASAPCAEGLECNNKECVKPTTRKAGDACLASCGTGLVCVNSNDPYGSGSAVAGHCVEPPHVGERGVAECYQTSNGSSCHCECEYGAYCRWDLGSDGFTTGICTRRITGAEGDDCDRGFAAACGSGLRCDCGDDYYFCEEGVCVSYPTVEDEEPCANAERCLYGSSCIDGICKPHEPVKECTERTE